ncbi:hypothetical protein FKM82_026256 [Ascaphus truei]
MGKVPNFQGGPYSVGLVQEGQGLFCSDAGAVTTGIPNPGPLDPPEPEIWIHKFQLFPLSRFLELFLPPPLEPMARPALLSSTLLGGPGFGDPVVVEWGEA